MKKGAEEGILLNCDSAGHRVVGGGVYVNAQFYECIHMENTHTHTYIVDRNTPTSMGVVRKRKANKYLLTQQKWRMVVHWWKQKAEDEERRARKPAGCRPCALLVPALKTRGRREGRTEERRGQGGGDKRREDGRDEKRSGGRGTLRKQ